MASGIFVIFIGIVAIIFFLRNIIVIQNQKDKIIAAEEVKKIALQKESEYIANKYNAKATVLCRLDSVLPKISVGDLCYLIADLEKLTIITRSTPTVTYLLPYNKIQLFKQAEIKDIHQQSANAPNSLTLHKIIIQYKNESDSEIELQFTYGDTGDTVEDRYNQKAFTLSNIFDYVNSHISPQENITEL